MMLSIRSTDPKSPDFLTQDQDENQRPAIQAKVQQELPLSDPSQSLVEEGEVNPGLIQKFLNFLGLSNKNEKPVSTDAVENRQCADPIGYAPILEPPAGMDPQLKNFKLPKPAETSTHLNDEQIFDGLSKISDKTITGIMMIVLKAQSELEREGMILDLDTMDKFQKIQSLRQKALQEIKLALQKDEKLLSTFKTVQDIAFAVGTLATLIVFSGLLGGFPTLAAGAAGLSALSAGTSGIATAGKSYADVRQSENAAQFTRIDHQKENTQGHMKETSNRMEQAMQSKTDKLFSELLRSMIDMARMINS